MIRWVRRDKPLAGSVLLRGSPAPCPENTAYLEAAGYAITPSAIQGSELWRLSLAHPEFGEADLVCPEPGPLPDPEIVDLCWLTEAEKAEAKCSESSLVVEIAAGAESPLRDRIRLLRFLGATASDHAVAVIDHQSLRFWSRADLDDELSHDADVDVEALYQVHFVVDDAENDLWVHSHGLSDLGHSDFCLVPPYEGAECDVDLEMFRALAASILEGDLRPDGQPWELVYDRPNICLVPVREYLSDGDPFGRELLRDLTEDVGADHVDEHAVVCTATPNGGLARLFGAGKHQTADLFWDVRLQSVIFRLSTALTELTADRARMTYDSFCHFLDEFADEDIVASAKLGFPTDRETGREHLWFEVHQATVGHLDAMLANSPDDVSALSEGMRANQPVELLTDWFIRTPQGRITPRTFTAARKMREAA